MPQHYSDPNDETQPVDPRYSQGQPGQANPAPPAQGSQGKLVLGSFNQQPSAPRQPYQYQPNNDQTQYAPYGAYTPPQPDRNPNHQQQARLQGQVPYQQQKIQSPPNYPYTPDGRSSTPNQGQRPIPGNTTPGPQKRPRRRRGCMYGCLTFLVIFIVLAIFVTSVVSKVMAFGSAISAKAPLSTETGYMSTSDRTNMLIMGYGGGTHEGAYLTDSLVVASLIPNTGHTSLVSVPRDLWVRNPGLQNAYSKINAIYEYTSNNGKNINSGADAVRQKISDITGIDVKYWMSIDFTGFKQFIDSIGGVDVNVPDSFNACYPNNDDDKQDASWKTVQFDKGPRHMTGEQAIEYARAREPMEVCSQTPSMNLAELTDFGRSARQQLIIKSAISQVKQAGTWPHLYAGLDALQNTIHTNMSLADLGEFALKMDLNDPKAARIGLSNQNVLMDSTSYDGQYILTAAHNDWAAVKTYVKEHLYA